MPVETASPIWNRHSHKRGSINRSVNSTPLRIMTSAVRARPSLLRPPEALGGFGSAAVRLTEAPFAEGNIFPLDEFFHDRSPDQQARALPSPQSPKEAKTGGDAAVCVRKKCSSVRSPTYWSVNYAPYCGSVIANPIRECGNINVGLRRTQSEQLSSGLPSKADVV